MKTFDFIGELLCGAVGVLLAIVIVAQILKWIGGG